MKAIILSMNNIYRAISIALVVLFPLVSSAQTLAQKAAFSSINQVGLLTGGSGEAFMVQTINGVKKDKYFAGIGVGFDFYGLRSVPLFLDVRRNFSSGMNTPFAYINGGVNFLSLNYIQKEQARFPTSSPALYYDAGLGWRLAAKNNRAFNMSFGYTLKQVRYKVESYSISPTPQLQSENYDRYRFDYRRFVIKIGFQL